MIDLSLLIVLATLSTPLVTALHEAGHLLPALVLTDGPLTFRVGPRDEALATTRVGRVTFVVTRQMLRGSGEVRVPGLRSKRDAAVVLVGGPLTTAVTGLGAGLLAGIGFAHAWPHLAVLACTAFSLKSVLVLVVNGSRNSGTRADGTPFATDGEKLARLAGHAPQTQPPRTSPIAWGMLAVVVALCMLIAGLSVAQLACVAILAVPTFLLGRRAVAERRQRAR